MVTSYFRPEVEIQLFRACAMYPAIIGTVRSLGRGNGVDTTFHVFLFYIWIAFLRHYIHEFQTLKK